ncbi:MAG: hypothetical protein JRN06_03135 [Nitrososphaerota archaeon]|nr:hypothetical protein [Nitrososphaerota archaeon]MDG7023148.1 hypothetical protein [Nitrososphaerota archaeon]
MKVSTAATRKAIDRWKAKAGAEARRIQVRALDIVAGVITSTKRGRFALVPPVLLALSLNFALVELAILVVAGFYIAKLQCYRFVNSILRVLSFPR